MQKIFSNNVLQFIFKVIVICILSNSCFAANYITKCYKNSIRDINNDNINLGYKLDKNGRQYYYIYYFGACQAYDDYNNKVDIRSQESFHNVFIKNTHNYPNILKPSTEYYIIAWKGYMYQYSQMMLKDSLKNTPQSNKTSEAYTDVVLNSLSKLNVDTNNVAPLIKLKIKLELDPNMNINNISIIKPSSDYAFDNNVVNAISALHKLPQLPNDANYSDYKTLRITILPSLFKKTQESPTSE